jgi:hypothetical protein
MSEHLIHSITPSLAAPVTRGPLSSGPETDAGAEQAVIIILPPIFADDDAE